MRLLFDVVKVFIGKEITSRIMYFYHHINGHGRLPKLSTKAKARLMTLLEKIL